MGKTVRMTISVPRETKDLMDAINEEINWSAVASRAFSEKLHEIATRRKSTHLFDVVARLRRSSFKSSNSEFKLGVEYGRDWAMKEAEAIELERLDFGRRSFELLFQGECTREDSIHGSNWGDFENFFYWIRPEAKNDAHAPIKFWESIMVGDTKRVISNSDFIRGFSQGALDIWNEVKKQVGLAI